MLEADQKRFATKYDNLLREAAESKSIYDEKLRGLKEERVKLDQREAELLLKEKAIERERLELQDNLNAYQKQAEALRKANLEHQRNSHDKYTGSGSSSMSSSHSTGSLHHAPKKNRADRSRERRSQDGIAKGKKDSIPSKGQTLSYRLLHVKSYNV